MANARQRVLTALDGDEPDRVPCALGFCHFDLDSLLPAAVVRDDPVDVLFVRFPLSPEEHELARSARPHAADTRLGNAAQQSTYRRWRYAPEDRVLRNPLAAARSLDDLRRFPFPDIGEPYVVETLAGDVERLHERGLAVGGGLPHLGGELFEAAWRLRGLENFLIDLVRRPDWAHFLLDRLAALARRNAETLARAGIDVLALDDDVGMPGTMMISPATWREFFKPRLADIIGAARDVQPELRVLYHSDGWFEPILDDLVEIGVDAVNPLQPEHMDPGRVRASFGSRLTLWGAVGCQTTFSFGTPETIRLEVRRRIETLGRSALVLAPAYDIDEPDIPPENLVAFFEAVRRYG